MLGKWSTKWWIRASRSVKVFEHCDEKFGIFLLEIFGFLEPVDSRQLPSDPGMRCPWRGAQSVRIENKFNKSSMILEVKFFWMAPPLKN